MQFWPFRSQPKQPPPVLTNDAFRRWLRAHKPPMELFLRLSEAGQETLAALGDEHSQDLAIAIGYAVADPQLADAGISAAGGDVDAEMDLAKRVAQDLCARMAAKATKGTKPMAPRTSFVGMTDRRHEASATRVRAAAKGKSLFGRQPDEATQ